MADGFHTTQWSVVLAAGDDQRGSHSHRALESLCQTYWSPLYAYVRHKVRDEHLAQDLTQTFFERLLEKETLATADPQRGRFRTFLLTACERFLINEWQKDNAIKRGGGRRTLSLDFDAVEARYSLEPQDRLTAEVVFERQWVIALIDSVLAQLRQEYVDRNQAKHFDWLKPYLTGGGRQTYAALAETMNSTEAAVKIAVHRLRTRYRDQIRSEIAQTVASPDDVEDEIRRLFEVLAEKR
ncbi:RNA polymerase sigma factor [Fuerstiella marisgermanici]|uniref:RNA polymerase sigma factor n=1 Tax=Fuerstiella marisgermanici TaxID=1891926 RepID=A0A1P8WHU0_9PLAN|nr:sigma factor [Fuerstiella marisgermanici]APZ93626.1 RNA polymerase sigma factor [Fuerstiella marisgermanici]